MTHERKEYQHNNNNNNNNTMPSSTASPSTAKPAPVDAKRGHSNLSAPSSLANLDPDLLRQILGFAQPTEHHHRFEWAGLVGRTCRVFHSISRETGDVNGGVVVDLNKFESYCSVVKARFHPRDLRVNFLSVLLEKDEVARARMTELHFNPGVKIGNEVKCDSSRPYDTRTANKIYEKRLNKRITSLLASLRSLLQEPNSFPNLTCLDIYRPYARYRFELISRKLLQALPSALPKLDHLCLGNCFDWEECWMNEGRGAEAHAMKEMADFVSSLRTPLRSLSLYGVPWMTDGHVQCLLRHVGEKLETLELVNCFRAYPPEWDELDDEDSYGMRVLFSENREALSVVSLNAVARYCRRLKYFRLLDEKYKKKTWTWDNVEDDFLESMELVKESNPELTDVVDYEDIYDTVFSPQWFRDQPFYIEKGTIYQNPTPSPPPE